jgi:uncharacterized protein
MSEVPEFIRIQLAFTQHLRDPLNHPTPLGLEDRRVRVYRELIYNNIEQQLAESFPVLRAVTADDRWHPMIRDYLARHQARTPYFPRMTQEFLHYLETEREIDCDPPYLRELAHYEWIEGALAIEQRSLDFGDVEPRGDLLRGIPVLSPLAWPLAYRFPVHRIRPDFVPGEAPDQATHLVVYRDRQDDIGFLELNAVTARLLELIMEDRRRTGRQLLAQVARELQHPQPGVVFEGGHDILEQLRARDVLLGVLAG